MKEAFEGENRQTQYSVLGYRLILILRTTFAIEFDELGHNEINIELKRQKAIEKELGFKFIRINPDEQNFHVFKSINEIHRCTKQSSKKSLVDKFSERLSKLEFKSNRTG